MTAVISCDGSDAQGVLLMLVWLEFSCPWCLALQSSSASAVHQVQPALASFVDCLDRRATVLYCAARFQSVFYAFVHCHGAVLAVSFCGPLTEYSTLVDGRETDCLFVCGADEMLSSVLVLSGPCGSEEPVLSSVSSSVFKVF